MERVVTEKGRPRWSNYLAVVAAVVLCTGCMVGEDVAAMYRSDSQFAETFIRDFHGGGLPQVRARVKPASLRNAPDAEASFTTMRSLLPAGAIDSMRSLDADIETNGGMRVSKLAYRVYGGRQAALVRLWIETAPRATFVETFSVSDISPEVWPAAAPE